MNKKIPNQHKKKEAPVKQAHSKKADQGKRSGPFESHQPKEQGKGLGKGAGSQGKGWMTDDGGGKQEKGWMNKDDGLNQGKWIPEGGSKNETPWIPEASQTQNGCLTKLKSGCFPKVLILFLAFIAIGATLVLA